MDYLIIKEKFIKDFLDFLDPFEQVSIMCIQWKDNNTAYRVSGMRESFRSMIQREYAEYIA